MNVLYSFEERKTPLLRGFHGETLLLASGARHEVYQVQRQRLKQIPERGGRVGTLVLEDLVNQTIIIFLHIH